MDSKKQSIPRDVFKKLSKFQLGIIEECIEKCNGMVYVPMGSGKTFMGLCLSLMLAGPDDKVLVVASKSLVASWVLELKKFFGDSLPYEVLHRSYIKDLARWKPQPETRIVITNPSFIGNNYRDYELEKYVTTYRQDTTKVPHTTIKYYLEPTEPLLNHSCGSGYIFSVNWGCLLVDEIQGYNNIETNICQGLMSIVSKKRWGLSGTPITNPKTEMALGFYRILHEPGTPRSIPDTEGYLRKGINMPNLLGDLIKDFKGLTVSMVRREKNEMFVKRPKVNTEIAYHPMSPEEIKTYTILKEILKEVAIKANLFRQRGDKNAARRFSTYKLAMLGLLRECLISPFIPLGSAAVDMLDFSGTSDLATALLAKTKEMGLEKWINDEESLYSSRIKHIIKKAKCYEKEKIVIFTCFRTALNLIKYYLERKMDRLVFELSSSHNISKRGKIIEDFSTSDRGILLLTYDIGSEGLNLQTASTVFLVDFWWNASKTEQAIARLLRFGQENEQVNIVYFTSQTAIEKAILSKQKGKLDIISEMMVGHIVTKIEKIKTDDIIKMIDAEDNINLIKSIYS